MNQRLFKTTLFVFVALVSGVVSAQGLLNRRAGLLNSRTGQRSAQRAGGAQQAPADEAEKSTEDILKDIPKGTNGVPTRLAFDQAPLEVLLYAYADVAGKILIPAPNLPKTQITLKTFEDRELTKEEYLEAIEVTLTMNGVVLEPFDKIFLRAFERKTVRTQGIRTSMDMPTTNSIPEKGRVVSQLIRLQHITAEEAQKALEGFKDPNGLFQVFERNNTILVTDTQENLNRMLEVVRELDVATPVTEDVFVRQIQYAAAMEIKTALETIVTESQKDAQQAKGGAPKESGAPGFGGGTRPSLQPNRLLNLNRPGLNKPEPPPTTPNATMMAQVSDADRGMIRGKVLILADERSNKLIVITAKTNMDFFDKVIETLDVETTPEVEVEVIRLKYAESEEVASMLNDLIGNGSSSSSQSKNNQNQNAAKNGTANRNLTQTRAGAGGAATRPQTANPTFSKSASSSLGELNKDNIKILADKRINGIVVMARKADMRAVKEVIEDMDVKLSQVLIETVIIEVTLGDDLKTGIDWVQRGRQHVFSREQVKDSYGRPMFWEETTDDEGNKVMKPTTEDTGFPLMETIKTLRRDGFYNNGSYMLGGGGGGSAGMLGSLMNVAAAGATNGTAATAANPIGGGLNYLLKSDKLNLAAVIQASKTDTRAKYIASPIVMTVDNKEAIVEATESRKFYSGSTTTTSYSTPVTSYSYTDKDIGIKIKVTPKINPDGTVMLTVEEEYSQLGAGQSVLVSGSNGSTQQEPIDTAVSRKMSADVLLDNMQTVILGGLTETYKSDKETGIPILKDIPWIGKWLFGSVTQNETRKELLVFMTPYVLDDADAAQAEAIRRKKTLSDPRPWEDNGWSLSPVADPVAKKELLRRLNDEWSRQDEERRNQKALEEAKAKRAKKLAEMDEEERREWAEKHQKEILEEQERFEGEQKDLREIIDSIREKRKPEEATPVAEPGNEAASAPKSE
ncbi:MAG: secretin N-terminal domain-containing protein [Kiritimatiellia bacterium]